MGGARWFLGIRHSSIWDPRDPTFADGTHLQSREKAPSGWKDPAHNDQWDSPYVLQRYADNGLVFFLLGELHRVRQDDGADTTHPNVGVLQFPPWHTHKKSSLDCLVLVVCWSGLLFRRCAVVPLFVRSLAFGCVRCLACHMYLFRFGS